MICNNNNNDNNDNNNNNVGITHVFFHPSYEKAV